MLADRYEQSDALYLLGGSALLMLGSQRLTADIDYLGDDRQVNELQRAIKGVAKQLGIDVEAVPIDEFLPLPPGALGRSIFVGQFGTLAAYAFDPYTIALSKLDRGFDTDIQDILFLVDRGYVDVEQLETLVAQAVAQAGAFDLDPAGMRRHLDAVRERS